MVLQNRQLNKKNIKNEKRHVDTHTTIGGRNMQHSTVLKDIVLDYILLLINNEGNLLCICYCETCSYSAGLHSPLTMKQHNEISENIKQDFLLYIDCKINKL